MLITLEAVELVDGDGERCARKIIDWPALPRKDEKVLVAGTFHNVLGAYHQFPAAGNEALILVAFHCDTKEFDRILQNPGWQLRR